MSALLGEVYSNSKTVIELKQPPEIMKWFYKENKIAMPPKIGKCLVNHQCKYLKRRTQQALAFFLPVAPPAGDGQPG